MAQPCKTATTSTRAVRRLEKAAKKSEVCSFWQQHKLMPPLQWAPGLQPQEHHIDLGSLDQNSNTYKWESLSARHSGLFLMSRLKDKLIQPCTGILIFCPRFYLFVFYIIISMYLSWFFERLVSYFSPKLLLLSTSSFKQWNEVYKKSEQERMLFKKENIHSAIIQPWSWGHLTRSTCLLSRY